MPHKVSDANSAHFVNSREDAEVHIVFRLVGFSHLKKIQPCEGKVSMIAAMWIHFILMG